MEKLILKNMMLEMPADYLKVSKQTDEAENDLIAVVSHVEDAMLKDDLMSAVNWYAECHFEEGFIFALKTMKAYRNLLDEPEKYFKEMLEG